MVRHLLKRRGRGADDVGGDEMIVGGSEVREWYERRQEEEIKRNFSVAQFLLNWFEYLLKNIKYQSNFSHELRNTIFLYNNNKYIHIKKDIYIWKSSKDSRSSYPSTTTRSSRSEPLGELKVGLALFGLDDGLGLSDSSFFVGSPSTSSVVTLEKKRETKK